MYINFSALIDSQFNSLSYDKKIQGTVFSYLIDCIDTLEEGYDNGEYFYSTKDEKIIDAYNFLKRYGTPKIISTLKLINGNLGTVYQSGINNMKKSIIVLGKDIPPEYMKLLSDNTNFAEDTIKQIGDNLISAVKNTPQIQAYNKNREKNNNDISMQKEDIKKLRDQFKGIKKDSPQWNTFQTQLNQKKEKLNSLYQEGRKLNGTELLSQVGNAITHYGTQLQKGQNSQEAFNTKMDLMVAGKYLTRGEVGKAMRISGADQYIKTGTAVSGASSLLSQGLQSNKQKNVNDVTKERENKKENKIAISKPLPALNNPKENTNTNTVSTINK